MNTNSLAMSVKPNWDNIPYTLYGMTPLLDFVYYQRNAVASQCIGNRHEPRCVELREVSFSYAKQRRPISGDSNPATTAAHICIQFIYSIIINGEIKSTRTYSTLYNAARCSDDERLGQPARKLSKTTNVMKRL